MINKYRVSDLAKYKFCPKRMKIEIYHPNSQPETHAMQKGTHMHKIYSSPVKSFDREMLMLKLESNKVFYAFQRLMKFPDEQYLIRGIPDDFRILLQLQRQEKYVSLIEVKTTNHESLWSNEEAAACFQLQLYVWLMRPILESYGYKIWKHHYLEIYSQKTGKLIKRIPVFENPEIECEIISAVNSIQGLSKMTVRKLLRAD